MGGGLMPDFFMRTRKLLARVTLIMPDFLFVIENKLGGVGVIPKFLVCTQNILLRGGGELCQIFFMCTRKLLGRGEFIPKFLVCTQRILLGGGGCYANFFYV